MFAVSALRIMRYCLCNLLQDTYEYYDNYEVYDLYDIYNYYSNCKRLPFEGSSRAAGEGWLL